jgi:hypothetical protein
MNYEEAKSLVPSPEALISLQSSFHACLGDADGFFEWAEKAIIENELQPEDARYVPWLDKVRSDHRSEGLLRSLPT